MISTLEIVVSIGLLNNNHVVFGVIFFFAHALQLFMFESCRQCVCECFGSIVFLLRRAIPSASLIVLAPVRL